MNKLRRKLEILAAMLFSLSFLGAAQLSFAATPDSYSAALLKQEVSRQLSTLPYYGVFDNITFRISAKRNVMLSGDVTRPGLKRDAEVAIQGIHGVRTVVNDIQVLPKSPTDDSIRWEVFKAIFEKPGLQKYATQTVDPLRIIVRNGVVALDGAVTSRYDRTMIDECARSVSEASGVIDNLVIQS